MLFLRETRDPLEDVRRGFSGNPDAWTDTLEKAERWRAENGPGREPAYDHRSRKWNADPHPGLVGFAVDSPAALSGVLSRLDGAGADALCLFESGECDLGVGGEIGEDAFRDAAFLGRVRPGADWAEVEEVAARGAAQRYMEGDCHNFAVAVARETDWPMVALMDFDDMREVPGDDEEVPTVLHVCVETPDGMALDAKGRRPFDDVIADFEGGDRDFIECTEHDLSEWVSEGRLGPLGQSEIDRASRLSALLVALPSHGRRFAL